MTDCIKAREIDACCGHRVNMMFRICLATHLVRIGALDRFRDFIKNLETKPVLRDMFIKA